MNSCCVYFSFPTARQGVWNVFKHFQKLYNNIQNIFKKSSARLLTADAPINYLLKRKHKPESGSQARLPWTNCGGEVATTLLVGILVQGITSAFIPACCNRGEGQGWWQATDVPQKFISCSPETMVTAIIQQHNIEYLHVETGMIFAFIMLSSDCRTYLFMVYY